MRADFDRATRLGDVVRWAGELSARTMIFDVEPLVAYWDGGQDALEQGIARVLSEVSVLSALQVLCFATNSSRRPSVVPDGADLRVVYLASAGKPLRTAAYRRFPRPGVVIGIRSPRTGSCAPARLCVRPVRPAVGGSSRRAAADGRRRAASKAAAVHPG